MLAPIPPGTDYFAAMGLPRKLGIDRQDLEKRYHELSRRFHPDFFQMAAPRDRLISLESSALINKAYRTLRDPLTRAEYLVRLIEGAEADPQGEAPQALFEEILEVNELLSEYRQADAEERVAFRSQLESLSASFRAEYDALYRKVTEELFPRWDQAGSATGQPRAEQGSVLSEIRRCIAHRAYLHRVLANLEETLSPEVSDQG